MAKVSENSKGQSLLKVAQSMMVNGLMAKEMVKENNNGKTDRDTRVSGRMEKQVETASSITRMVTLMKESGSTAKQTVMERTPNQMEQSMRGSGEMINNMALV